MIRRVLPLVTLMLVARAGVISAQAPDVIYHNAKVVTVNARFEIAEAVAIRGGTIVGVGTNERIKALAGPATTVVDLAGKPLLPGFYDNHIHLGEPLQPWKYGMITAVPEWLRTAHDVESLVAALKAKAAVTPKGQWITGDIPREEWPNAALPTRWHLDKATTEHPVALARGPHTLLVNSKALSLAGVTRLTKPPGGEIVHDAKGEPTGKILEAARRVITRVMPATTSGGGADTQVEWWRTLLNQLASLGITSVNVAGVRPDSLPLVKRLYEQHGAELPRMTVQLRVSPGFDSHDDPQVGASQSIAEIEAIGDPQKFFALEKVKLGAVKMSIDGGLSAPIFWSLKPYENRPGFFGEQRIPDSAFARVARRAHDLGWQLGIHTMGDAAVVMVVNELEKILRASPRANHRHYLHHVAVLPPVDTIKKMAALPIMVASQPGFLLGLGAYADEALEPEREATQQPSRSLLAHGVRVSYGSDAGPYGPIAALYAAVTRRGWNGVVKGEAERVTIEEAIRMHTFEPAYFTFDEHTRGSIEVGKAADFVVLDRDVLTIDAERIQDVQVLRTIVAGREVYSREALASQVRSGLRRQRRHRRPASSPDRSRRDRNTRRSPTATR